jgi:enoyl-CoA hydratase
MNQALTPRGDVRLELDAAHRGIAYLTFSHRNKLNAISESMWLRLRELAQTLDEHKPTLRAVVLRGEEGNFAAGADIAEFPSLRFEGLRLRHYHELVIAPALAALRSTDVPLIAQIEGACVGAGLEIAACCDIRVAAPDARLGVPIARLGFPMAPDELRVLVDCAGEATARELLLEAGLVDAGTALRRGIVHALADDVAAEALTRALRVAAGPASVARANKRTLRALRHGALSEEQRAQHFSYAASKTHREGVSAFLQSRRPDFRED